MKYRPKKTLLNLKYIIHWKVYIHMENSHILKQMIQKAEYFQLSNTVEDATYYVMDRKQRKHRVSLYNELPDDDALVRFGTIVKN